MKKRKYPATLLVRGQERVLRIEGEEPRAVAYFTLEEEELAELSQKLRPITFPPSSDVPIGYPGEIGQLGSVSVVMAKALLRLYADEELRRRALPPFLASLVDPEDVLMAGVGFDFWVGRHLERPMFLEAAAFGPEFVSSVIMAEFFGIRTLEERLSTWWHSLVEPGLKGAKSLHYITSFGDFDFTREREHEVLIPYLREQCGIKATYGPAESPEALKADALYIRAGLQFPPVWRAARKTGVWARIMKKGLWARILRKEVKVIPPLGNNFFSSKFWHPLFANPEELMKRGAPRQEAELVASHMPATLYLDHNLEQFLRYAVGKKTAVWLKGCWHYGGYASRRVIDPHNLTWALREIRAAGEMPVIVQEEIQPGFLPYDPARELPDREVQVRVRVFFHKEGKIKTLPPSARISQPGRPVPWDSLYLDSSLLPQPEAEEE